MSFDLVEESKNLISIRSDHKEGTRGLVLYLAPFCRRIGFQVTLQAATNGDAGRDLNLIAHTVSTDAKNLCPDGIALVTHLDTVPAGDLSLWTASGGDPFQASIQGEKIYGLGSADTKLDILCKLKALWEVGLENIKIPLALIGTFGEERALAGVRLLRESKIVEPKYALVGEPSNLEAVIAHKGILYMRGVWETSPPAPLLTKERVARGRVRSFKGKAAHGSLPHLGDNAILKAIRWLLDEGKKNPNLHLQRIQGGTVHNIVPEKCEVSCADEKGDCPRINFLQNFFQLLETADRYLAAHRNDAFDPPRTTWNVGVIRGDLGRIEIEFDFRLIPETDGNTLFQIFSDFSRQVPGARVEVIRSNAPMNTPRESVLAREVATAMEKVGLPVRFAVKSGNTEAAILNEMGAESIVIGPGQSVGNIHAPNEYNEIPQLTKAVEFYAAFLRQFC